jgi:alkanesulfonate monooxygenase SsuD/methylene tetrahydromethanopterin reductase-like flavin-dependent oxidoreductase (luciferase family)
VKVGYVMFPQGNVSADPNRIPDQERMQREIALAHAAGDLGFDGFWVTEHHFGDYNLAPAPLTVLAYMAGRFPTIELGTMVVVLPWNDPLRIIEQVVVLDYLCDGRLTLGIGKGEAAREFQAFGMDLEEGRRRFDANVDLILEAFDTGVLRIDGQPPLAIRPSPARPMRDRVLMAAGSPFSLDRAADCGLGLLRIALRSWDDVEQQVTRHRERFTAAHGHAPRPCVVLTYAYCDRDRGKARELGTAYARAYRESAIAHYGLADGEADLQRFADAQLWGTPDELVEKVAYVVERTGTNQIGWAFRYAGVPYAEGEASMRLFAAEVMPRLRRLPVEVS